MDIANVVSSLENKLFINNEYVEYTNKHLTVTDPATGEVVSSSIANAGQDALDKAVAAAEAASRLDSPWRAISTMQRARLLWKAADLVEQEETAHTLSLLEAKSFGRPYSLNKAIDIKVCADNLRYFAGWCDKIPGDGHIRDGDLARLVRREPLGVVAAIMAWNGPVSAVGMKLGPALAAGNCVILKPSEKTPLGTLYMARIFAEAGFPPGVVQVLTGDGQLGNLIGHHERIRKISFTGSLAVGKKVQEAAAKSNLKRVTLELGGKSPIVVFDDANLQKAAFWAAAAIASNSGQYCIAGSRVYVQRGVVDQFRTHYHKCLSDFAAGRGLPSDPKTTYGTVADRTQYDKIRAFIEQGKKEAESSFNATDDEEEEQEKGCYIMPIVFEKPIDNASIYKDEIFGPVSVLKTFLTEEEVIRAANATKYGLMASVFTRDLDRATRLSEALEAGTVCINTSMALSPRAPFGGQKQSGYGCEGGLESVLSYTQVKTVVQAV